MNAVGRLPKAMRWLGRPELPQFVRRGAHGYMLGWSQRSRSKGPSWARTRAEAKQFADTSAVRLIFESNIVENAGRESLGATRALLADNKLFDTSSGLAQGVGPPPLRSIWLGRRATLTELLEHLALTESEPWFSYRFVFVGRSRADLDVLCHAQAIHYVRSRSASFRFRQATKVLASSLLSSSSRREAMAKWTQITGGKVEIDRVPEPRLVDQALVGRIHAILSARSIEDMQARSPYRAHMVVRGAPGAERAYVAPESIGELMRRWVRRSNLEARHNEPGPLERAAWLSHEFVRIHPFEDYNGRTSRLLLNLALSAEGLPFMISLGHTAKWKQRYRLALHAGDQGELEPMTTLTAHAILRGFGELNDALRSAGVRPIVPPQGYPRWPGDFEA